MGNPSIIITLLMLVHRFLLQLSLSSTDRGLAVLNVVETNPFRHLNHLSLKFVPASDTYLKKYLAECLLGLKVCVWCVCVCVWGGGVGGGGVSACIVSLDIQYHTVTALRLQNTTTDL